MADLQRGATSTSVIDVLDHILDKGIVIDAWMRVSVIGIDLITVEARVVVASIDTYVNNADAVASQPPAFATFSRAPVWQPSPHRSLGERRREAPDLRKRKPGAEPRRSRKNRQ